MDAYLGLQFIPPWQKPNTDAPPWAKETPVFQDLPEPITIPVRKRERILKIDEGPVQRRRAFPKADEAKEETGPLLPTRSWQEPVRRISHASYSAVEIHGFYGLIDDGSDAAGRVLIVHVPKWIRGYFIDIKQGDTLHVNRVDGKAGGTLTVLSTGRHKYFPPGRRVTTFTVCVPEEQWAPFSRI